MNELGGRASCLPLRLDRTLLTLTAVVRGAAVGCKPNAGRRTIAVLCAGSTEIPQWIEQV